MSVKHGMAREEATKVLGLIKFLEKKPEAYEFLKPVDFKALGLYDYPLIVKKPMDIATVKKNIKNGTYTGLTEAARDLNLVWENCKAYNPKEHFIYKQAEFMEKTMLEYITEHDLQGNLLEKRERSFDSGVSYQAKIDLLEKMNAVSHAQVGRIIEFIQTNCSSAIVALPDDRVQLKLDAIDAYTFYKAVE